MLKCISTNCCSRTKKCVAISTTEVEYVAMSECARKVLFLRHVFVMYVFACSRRICTKVFEDNEEGAVLQCS